MLRDFLGGRTVKIPVRFPLSQSPRSPPEANLPLGPFQKLSGNYYYTRDGRSEVRPPTTVADNTKEAAKSLESGGQEAEVADKAVARPGERRKRRRTPGEVYRYSQ